MSTWNRFAGEGNHRRGGRFKTGDKKAAPTKGCRTGISPAANILPLAVVCAVGRRSTGQIRSRLRARSSAALTPRRGVIHSRSPFAASRKTHSAAQESTKYMESNAALGEIPRTGPQREKKHTPSSVLRAGERYLGVLEHGITLGSTLIFPVC